MDGRRHRIGLSSSVALFALTALFSMHASPAASRTVAPSTATGSSPRTLEQAQPSAPVTEPLRYVYQNIRVTVTRRGIVAGDLRTGRVLWRRGFAPNPERQVLLESVRFVDRYFVYRYDAGTSIAGAFVDIVTGKDLLEATAVLAVEGTTIYLRNFDYFNRESRFFADIQVIRFESTDQSAKTTRFVVDRYVSSACADPTKGAINLEFVKKVGERWHFEFQNQKCDIALDFDFNNVADNVVKVVRKGGK